MHFIRSLPQDLMREAGLHTFSSDAEMLWHLKCCIQFSTKKPKKSNDVLPALMTTEASAMEEAEELLAVMTTLQAYGWQKIGNPPTKIGKPFVKFNCSLCD